MSIKQAIADFAKKHPDRIVKRCVDYDDRHYVIAAPLRRDEAAFDNVYFGIDKSTGEVTNYYPSSNFGKFTKLFGVNF